MKEQPFAGFIDDPNAGQEKQAGFDEGRKILDFPVAVLMVRVGGFVGDADRKIGYGSRYQVEARMGGFGKNTQAAAANADDNLQESDSHRGKDGVQGNRLLLLLHSGNADGLRHSCDYS